MRLIHEWNVDEQRWDFLLRLDDGRISSVYLIPTRTEAEKLSDIVRWLNRAFEANDAKETPSQSV